MEELKRNLSKQHLTDLSLWQKSLEQRQMQDIGHLDWLLNMLPKRALMPRLRLKIAKHLLLAAHWRMQVSLPEASELLKKKWQRFLD